MIDLKNIVFLLFFALIFFYKPIVADSEVFIEVDKKSVQVGEQVQILISAQGEKNVSNPEFPESNAYDIYFQGKSSRFEFVNNKLSSSIDFNYILVPKKKGEIKIPPISVRVGKEIEYTQPLTLEVSTTASLNQSTDSDELIFVKAHVDDTEVFVNQQIIYILGFYRAVNIKGATLEPLKFEGFQAEKLGKEREYTQIIDGRRFSVTEIRYALFPQKSGVLTIPPATLECHVLYRKKNKSTGFPFDSFFDDPFFNRYETRSQLLSTKQIDIHVNPLPTPEHTNLATSLVGEFKINASLSQNKIKVGESSTLTIEISGRGNIHSILEPPVDDIFEFKTYEDKPQLDIKTTQEGISGVKTFKKALVPTKPGKFSIPAIKLSYLDPDTGRYKTTSTKPISINVLPGTEEEGLHLVQGERRVVKKEEIKLLGKDILPQKTSISTLKDQSLNLSNPILLLLLFLPPLLFSAVLILEKKKRHIATDQAYYRRKNAQKGWKKNKKIIQYLIESDKKRFYTQTSQGFKQFLGDRLNVAGKALTPQEIDQRLHRFNVPEDLRKQLISHLQTLEIGEFGALHKDIDERKALLEESDDIIKKLIQWI